MRKIVILASVLLGAALITGTPAKAELGCTCVKIGAAPFCTSGVTQCTLKGGGVCVLPCDYVAPTVKHYKDRRHHAAKKVKMKKKKM